MPQLSDTNLRDPKGETAPSWVKCVFLIAVGLFLYLLLFKLPWVPFFADSDQSIFLYEAERMFNGDVIYCDFFEFTLPGTQALYALLFSIFGLQYWIVGAATLIVGVLTAWLLLKISERLLPSPLSFLPAILYVFFGFRWFGLDGSHRMFSPIFILLAIWLLMKGKGVLNLTLVGASLAMASFFTQQRGFVVLAAILTFLFIDRFLNRKVWSVFFKAAAVTALSFAACLAVLCIYFVIAAGPDNFFYATFTYPYKFYSFGHPNNFGVFFIDLKKAFTISRASDILQLGPVIFYGIALPFVNLALLVIFLKNRKIVEWNAWRLPFLIALVGLFLTLGTTAPNQYRLFQIAGPSLIVFAWLFNRINLSVEFKQRLVYVVAAGVMFLGAFQAFRTQTHWDTVYIDSPTGKLAMFAGPHAERYQWLSEHTAPGDYFFEVYEPFVYFPLRLKNPTRFGQIWPSAYTQPEHVAEVVRDLSEKEPKFILWDNGYSNPRRLPGDHTGPLADFVQMRYSPIGDIYEIDSKAIQIWEIKPGKQRHE